MKPLDVTASLDYGYRLIWAERHYLLRLVLVPMVIKFICLMLIFSAGLEQEKLYLRSTLMLLPSFFADGWMAAHLSRLVFLGQRWPFRPTGDAVKDGINLNNRAHGVMAGMLFFVVIQYLLSGVYSFLLINMAGIQAEMAPVAGQIAREPNPWESFAALALMGLSLWSVRLMFLYIPAAVGAPLGPIVNARQNFLLSLQMLGVMLVSAIPLEMLSRIVLNAVIPDGMKAADFSLGMTMMIVAWKVMINTITYLITTASIAYGIKLMMEARKA